MLIPTAGMEQKASDFFTSIDQENIRKAISDAELETSGEIRVHIENRLHGDVLDRAAFIFKKLEMDKTEKRNGVLIYLAVISRRFAIIGDSGINRVVPADYWDAISNAMAGHFREGRFTEGLVEAIHSCGHQLRSHFPYRKGDTNELSNEISFGHQLNSK